MAVQFSQHIPVVKLPTGNKTWQSDSGKKAISEIDAACRSHGYFYLLNHGLDTGLIADTFAESRSFYGRDLANKELFSCSPNSQFLGYRELGAEKSLSHTGAEACEQYRIGNIVKTGRDEDAGIQTYFHEPFASSMSFFDAMVGIGDRLMQASALGLGLDEGYFKQFMQAPLHRLGLNFYKPGAGAEIGNSVSYAMSAHIDHAVFTVLAQDALGLEVLDSDQVWKDVPTDPDTLFVFLGDYLQRWSNGQYRAATHRVRGVDRDRHSIQYKHKPSYATVIKPLPNFISDANEARYGAFDTGVQYQKLLQTLLAKPNDNSVAVD